MISSTLFGIKCRPGQSGRGGSIYSGGSVLVSLACPVGFANVSKAGKVSCSQLLARLKDFGGGIGVHDLLAAEAALADGDGDNHGIITDLFNLIDVAQPVGVDIATDGALKTFDCF